MQAFHLLLQRQHPEQKRVPIPRRAKSRTRSDRREEEEFPVLLKEEDELVPILEASDALD